MDTPSQNVIYKTTPPKLVKVALGVSWTKKTLSVLLDMKLVYKSRSN
jgi:hypothetical protein